MAAGNCWLFGIDDGNFIRAQVHTDTADGFRTACCRSRPLVLEVPAGTATRKDKQMAQSCTAESDTTLDNPARWALTGIDRHLSERVHRLILHHPPGCQITGKGTGLTG